MIKLIKEYYNDLGGGLRAILEMIGEIFAAVMLFGGLALVVLVAYSLGVPL